MKGGLGILDQGLFSGINFLLNILLARWISPEMYGGFSASYSVLLLISTAQVALIAEPMSIFGADKYRHNLTSFLNYLLRIQWQSSLLLALFFVFLAWLVGNRIVQVAMIGMAIALPFILFYWYLRRAFYVEMQSGMAAAASFVYSISLLFLVGLIQYTRGLTSLLAYLAMALSSLAASALALRRLGVKFWGESAATVNLNGGVVSFELWEFGKWILPAYVAGWFTFLSYPFLITILLDTQSAGIFRAAQNLFLPFQQFLAAVTLLMLPWLSRQRAEFGNVKLFHATEALAWITGVAAILYCLFVVLFRREIMTFLYANELYSSSTNIIVYLAIVTLFGSVPLILGLGLRVLGQPNIILWSKAWASLFALIIGIPGMWMFKFLGVSFSLVGSVAIEAVVLLIYYFRIRRVSTL